MNIIYRSDSSSKIGSGHVIRSLTLAEELKKKGVEITFISRAHKGNLNKFIHKKGINVVELSKPKNYIFSKKNILEEDYKAWLGVSEEQDANETLTVIGDKRPEWLIVDHYSIGEKWEKKMRPYVKNIMAIDDLDNRPHDCDLLLDQNYSSNDSARYKGKIPDKANCMFGPKFALLHPEYQKIRQNLRLRNGKVKKVLIYFGGSDPQNLTSKTLQAFSQLELESIFLDVVIGLNHPNKREIETFCKYRKSSRCQTMLPNLAELMAEADLFIGAGGTTTWERLCLGLPSIVITTGKNQELTSKALYKDGYIQYIGAVEKVTVKMIAESIRHIINSPKVLERQSNNGKALVDGLGVQRVLKELLNYEKN